MGGNGPTTFDRVVEYCDGWMPIGGRGMDGMSLAEQIVLLKKQAEEAGRDPDSLNITCFGIRPDPEQIARFDEAGVNRVIFTLPSQERDEVTPLIDECAKLIS
jgi:alkanesulfonate monooxygenase SsuD/methylene tetrahydromethanopterin reductase-like flavin-dependent oxidoreductase (luciferase family)